MEERNTDTIGKFEDLIEAFEDATDVRANLIDSLIRIADTHALNRNAFLRTICELDMEVVEMGNFEGYEYE